MKVSFSYSINKQFSLGFELFCTKLIIRSIVIIVKIKTEATMINSFILCKLQINEKQNIFIDIKTDFNILVCKELNL